MQNNIDKLSQKQIDTLLLRLKTRFEKHMNRHKDLKWNQILIKLENLPEKLWILNEMERTGGEPDVVRYDEQKNEFLFYDCSTESPKGRRSLCYDQKALESRKTNKPVSSALEQAKSIGIDLLSEEQYRELQKLGQFDLKTSSWVKTPSDVRNLGGALFMDRRYGKVFIYHNGASSYYSVRGYRGVLRV